MSHRGGDFRSARKTSMWLTCPSASRQAARIQTTLPRQQGKQPAKLLAAGSLHLRPSRNECKQPLDMIKGVHAQLRLSIDIRNSCSMSASVAKHLMHAAWPRPALLSFRATLLARLCKLTTSSEHITIVAHIVGLSGHAASSLVLSVHPASTEASLGKCQMES